MYFYTLARNYPKIDLRTQFHLQWHQKIKSVLYNVRMAREFPRLVYRLYTVLLNIPGAFVAEIDKQILKFPWRCRGPQSGVINLGKRAKGRTPQFSSQNLLPGCRNPDRTVLARGQTSRSRGGYPESTHQSVSAHSDDFQQGCHDGVLGGAEALTQSTGFQQGCHHTHWGRPASSTDRRGEQDVYMQNEGGPLPHTTHKN